LTAVVKLFLKKPEESQGLVQKVLQAATAENDNPDIRDRAYVYWRLLSSDPQITKNIVLSEKPPITSTIQSLPPALLEQLITELSTLASVYQKPPEAFLGQGRFGAEAMQKAAIEYVHCLTVNCMLSNSPQGTATAGSGEPNCGGRCSSRCLGQRSTTKQRRKSSRYRFRRSCPGFAAKGAISRSDRPGRSRRYTAASRIASRHLAKATNQYHG
jgi:hypothetical protein